MGGLEFLWPHLELMIQKLPFCILGVSGSHGSLLGNSLLCSRVSPFLGILTACISFLLVCDPSFLSGERDFPASCSLRGGTSLQEVCSSPKLSLFLPSFDIFHYFPTALSIQTTICMILPLHPSNPFSFHFPSCSGILATLASFTSFRDPRTDHRFFPPALLHPQAWFYLINLSSPSPGKPLLTFLTRSNLLNLGFCNTT